MTPTTPDPRHEEEAERVLHDCNGILNDHDGWCLANNGLQVEMVAQALAKSADDALRRAREAVEEALPENNVDDGFYEREQPHDYDMGYTRAYAQAKKDTLAAIDSLISPDERGITL